MTESNMFPIEPCPNCGRIGEYIGVVDGMAKTIACKCGYRAPGMAVVGTQAPSEIERLTKELDAKRANNLELAASVERLRNENIMFRVERSRLREVLREIYEACMAADADGELDNRIDGDILDAARVVLATKDSEK